MRDSIRCTIGSPGRLLLRLPALIRSMFNPQLGVGYRFARFGLAIMSISRHLPRARNRIDIERDVMIPMRDGVRLGADVLRPAGEGRFPCLVVRHPYGRYLFHRPARQFAARGYAVVHADERGRFGSEGEWYLLRTNVADGRDLCEWIVRQPWSNGRIGGWGSSMLGINQWLLAVDNPLVTAIAPNMGSLDLRGFLHYGGAKPLSALVLLGNWVAQRKNAAMVDLLAWLPERYRALPISDIIHPSIGKLDWIQDLIAHDPYDPHFDFLDYSGKYASISGPCLAITGWYDMFCDAMIRDFQQLQAAGGEPGRRSRIVIGPWGHYWAPTMKALDEYIRFSGLETLKWYDHLFRGEANGVEQWPPVRYYVTGAEDWRACEKWPPPGTRVQKFFLGRQGKDGSPREEGRLRLNPPQDPEPPDSFIYDPADPVPTIGGDHLFFNPGCKDQARLERRPDVLVYRTDPLEEPLELAGPMRVVLQVSTDALDTDFTAKLVDAGPEGKVFNLRDNIIRLKHREFPGRPINEPSPVEPGQVYEVSINLGHLAHRFQRGHRIGLHVSSSNFPKFDRNLNTGQAPGVAQAMRTARQRVYHDQARVSCLELTVI